MNMNFQLRIIDPAHPFKHAVNVEDLWTVFDDFACRYGDDLVPVIDRVLRRIGAGRVCGDRTAPPTAVALIDCGVDDERLVAEYLHDGLVARLAMVDQMVAIDPEDYLEEEQARLPRVIASLARRIEASITSKEYN